MKDIVDYAEKSRIRKRKRQFFALLIGLLIGMLPTVNVLADTITFNNDGNTDSTTAAVGDIIQWAKSSSGSMKVIYTTPTGNQTTECEYTDSDKIKVNVIDWGIADLDHWNVSPTGTINENEITIRLSYVLKPAPSPAQEKDEAVEADEEEEEPVINHNPDALNAHYYLNGMLNDNYILGKTEQSPLGQIAFNAARPKGWNKAFSMSMSYQGRNEYSQKDGTLVLYIPEAYQKKGRKYAIMAIDKSGNVTILEDTDIYPYLITVSPGLEGYAYELIYSD